MSQQQVLSTPSAPSAKISHTHTCATAVRMFDVAVAKNRNKKRMADRKANRLALAWARNVLLAQIADPNEKDSFERFLAEKEKQFASQAPQRQDVRPAVLTLADAQQLLSSEAPVTAMVWHLLEREQKWDPADRGAIETEMRVSLASENRKRFAADGPLDALTLERAEEEAVRYIADIHRKVSRRRGGSANSVPFRRDRQPRPDLRLPAPNQRPSGPKASVVPASADQTRAEDLRNEIAAIEAEFAAEKEMLESQRWTDEVRVKKIKAVKALKSELAQVKERIGAEARANANIKRLERIARQKSSAIANSAIPIYKPPASKAPKEEDKAAKKKGGRKNRR